MRPLLVVTLLAGSALAVDKPSPLAERPHVATYRQSVPVRAAVIPSGTILRVRMDESIDTRRNRPGNLFHASLAQPLVRDGEMLLPRGTRFTGHVMESKPSGRLKGRAVLTLALDSFDLDGRGYRVYTGGTTRVSGRHRKRNLLLIGGGAGAGAGIGAIAGGGFGALVGAAAGSVAGTTTAVITGKKNVGLPAEALVNFPLRSSVRL